MNPIKDTRRALVRISYLGEVYKTFRGHEAKERFENEVKVLKYLENRGCAFVPRLLEVSAEELTIVTNSCGKIVEQLSELKRKSLFDELESYGVRHEDAVMRNVTYRQQDGRFCIIDFEFATILDDPEHKSPVAWPHHKEES
ncbi:MAG: serine/threonine protein phosphatase [Verrucomicrobiota bacterium]